MSDEQQIVMRAIRDTWMEISGDVLDAVKRDGEPGDYPMKQEVAVEIVLDRGIEDKLKGANKWVLEWWRSLDYAAQNTIGFQALPEQSWVL